MTAFKHGPSLSWQASYTVTTSDRTRTTRDIAGQVMQLAMILSTYHG